MYGLWLWIIAFSIAALLLGVRREPAGFIFGGAAVLLFLWQWFFCRKFVLVSYNDDGLHLDNVRNKETVGWNDVESVRRLWWVRSRPYMIKFRRPTSFGSKVYMQLPLGAQSREIVLSFFRSKVKVYTGSGN